MRFRTLCRTVGAGAATALIAAGLAAFGAAPAGASEASDAPDGDVLVPGASLYIDPHSTTLEAAAGLTGQARDDAQLLGGFPSATWLTKGTPAEVQAATAATATHATAAGEVPVFVVYNLPFRDCAQYSAGGALDTAAYTAWVDGVAAGIGSATAAIILEPDGLGIIPWNTDLNGNAEWCRPAELDPATAAADRYAQLNYAVDALTALPNTAVYLDGTHPGWLGVGDISDRLLKAGVERADGFFLNASNYIDTPRLQKYGHWISDCLRLEDQIPWWEPSYCASQYYPATPSDFSTWTLTDADYDARFADNGVTRDPAAQAHFVVDTSRNGQGAWNPPAWPTDIEAWCNPPDRGLGETPTTDTGDALLDAYLWIKVPGESDGQCFRGQGGPLDPIRGIEDPPAGQWFAVQARELIALASPAVAPPTCHVRYEVTRPLHGTFAGDLVITNLGSEPVDGWTLAWHWQGDERLIAAIGGSKAQQADAVTVTSKKLTAKIRPGGKTAIAFVGKGATDRDEPWRFTLNGQTCTSD